MFTGTTEQFSARPAGIFIYVENTGETDQNAMDAECTSSMKPTQQEYSHTCGFMMLLEMIGGPCST